MKPDEYVFLGTLFGVPLYCRTEDAAQGRVAMAWVTAQEGKPYALTADDKLEMIRYIIERPPA